MDRSAAQAIVKLLRFQLQEVALAYIPNNDPYICSLLKIGMREF